MEVGGVEFRWGFCETKYVILKVQVHHGLETGNVFHKRVYYATESLQDLIISVDSIVPVSIDSGRISADFFYRCFVVGRKDFPHKFLRNSTRCETCIDHAETSSSFLLNFLHFILGRVDVCKKFRLRVSPDFCVAHIAFKEGERNVAFG